jgi:hypothetical protein
LLWESKKCAWKDLTYIGEWIHQWCPWVQLENDLIDGAQGDNYHRTNYLFNVEPTKEQLEMFYSKSKALDQRLHGSCECQVVS